MKGLIQQFLQRLLGFDNYLYFFSLFKIRTLRWDSKEGDFNYFLRMIPSGSTVLDIGANIGIMTVPLSKVAAKVHAFEPVPDNLRALQRVLDSWKITNVIIHPVALGDRESTIEMVLPEVGKVKKQGLSHVVHESIPEFNEGQKFHVACRTLDNLEMLKDIRIDAIKIDVENYEYFVLKGGANLLAKYRPVIYAELWDNENRRLCFELLSGLGYSIKVLQNAELIPFNALQHRQQNFFFVPGN